MANDYFGVFRVQSQEFYGTFGYEAVACTVETVSSYFVVFIVFQWQTIQICFCRHGLMESGIKYCYLRYTWHQFAAYTDTDQVCRVVQRCQIVALFYGLDYFVCDNYGRRKFFSAVYDTVSDCIYFFQACDCTCFIIGQGIQNHLDSFFMCRHGSFCDFFVASCFLVYQSSVDSDSLTETFCQNFFCIGVDQLIFQR